MKKINLNQMNNILVIMLGGIGNLILLVPALRALRQSCPRAKIALMTGEPKVEDIIAADHLIDEVILHDRRDTQGIFQQLKFIGTMRQRKFDLSIVASSTNAFKGSVLTFLMGIPFRVGENINQKGIFYTHKVMFRNDIHELDGGLNLMKAIGIESKEEFPQISFFPEDEEMAGKFLAKQGLMKDEVLVGMHVGSGYKQTYKRWPKERFAHIADEFIKKYNVKVVFTGGPREVELVRETAKLMCEPSINSAGQLTLRQTAAVVKRCALLISNDSGLAHIATAVDTALIVLFGNTEIWRIAPRGRDVFLIKKEADDAAVKPINLITEEEVLAQAEKMMRK